MPFMHPTVENTEYFAVDTSEGTEIIPADALSLRVGAIEVSLLAEYLRGEPDDPEETIPRKTGWLARMSAPGYMDCTDWSAYDCAKDAWIGVIDDYCDDSAGSVTYRWLPVQWASALVNGDETALDDDEAARLHEWEAEARDGEGLDTSALDVIGEGDFRTHGDDGGAPGTRALFLFQYRDYRAA